MRMSRRMALNSQCGGKIKEPLYTGNYTITQIGEFIYMYLLTSGTLTIQSKGEYDLFCVGGGGKGGYGSTASDDETYDGCTPGGGGGGYTANILDQGMAANEQLSVIIGSGATAYGSSGGTTSIGSLLSAAGGKSIPRSNSSNNYSGAAGGSGGGAAGSWDSEDGYYPGQGGSNGSNGKSGKTYNGKSTSGGAGQGTTTRAFGESAGTLYAGGGGGGCSSRVTSTISGGTGGGGATRTAGTANTGGGGGGGVYNSYAGGAGGSGIAIIRWAA